MTINHKKIGEAIRARRKELKITQKELASRLKISQGYISDLEKGNINNPSLKKLELIADELNINLSKLFQATSNETKNQINTIAAHLDGKELTEEELEELWEYAEFILSKRNK